MIQGTLGTQARTGGASSGRGRQLCQLWDAGECAGHYLCEQLISHGFDLQALLTAGCALPWMGCLSFALKPGDNHLVTSSRESRGGSWLARGGWSG